MLFLSKILKEYFKQIERGPNIKKTIFLLEQKPSIKFFLLHRVMKLISLNKTLISRKINTNFFLENLGKFEFLFNNLNDDYSKNKYIQFVAFKVLDSVDYKLPYDLEYVLSGIKNVENLQFDKNNILNSSIGPLTLFNLKKNGY